MRQALTDMAARITVAMEVPPVATSKKSKKQEAESRERRQRLLDLLKEEVREETGDGSTLEERNDAAFDVLKDALWRREDEDLRGAVTTAVEVEVEGKRYGSLMQMAWRHLSIASGTSRSDFFALHWIHTMRSNSDAGESGRRRWPVS